jgi:cytosine/adenosine deaminase-related metal-dependent hydrolase
VDSHIVMQECAAECRRSSAALERVLREGRIGRAAVRDVMEALAETAARLDVMVQERARETLFAAEEVMIQAATGWFGQRRRGKEANH